MVNLSFGLNTLHYQGIASARPVMQINGHSFAGQYEDMLGTCLLVEKKNQDAQGSKGNHVSLTVTVRAGENGTCWHSDQDCSALETIFI